MIAAKIWKAGNSYVVTIPRAEMEARGLQVGQMVGIDPIPVEMHLVHPLTPEQRAAGWKTQEEVVQDLDERMGRDIAAGLFKREDVEQAERDIAQEAEWVQHL
jgi:antitoxin component of MazEF toxin-antitoxin module